ncbi:MAG: sulfate ABC transporter substrate-binding protein, partial [Arenimonas sp.]
MADNDYLMSSRHGDGPGNGYFQREGNAIIGRSMNLQARSPFLSLLIAGALALAAAQTRAREIEILNVSFDPTRELFQDINREFAAQWQAKTGEEVHVQMSHGGSGKQARAVIDGLDADVVTLALAADIDAIASRGKLLPLGWQARLPEHSAPYRSTIVLLVRKGNPKGIHDWNDLVRPGVAVITPNPKTSGGARWNYLAAWTYAAQHSGGDLARTREFMARLYRNVPVLDTGARGSTTTFVNRGIGDVEIAWENEAQLARSQAQGRELKIVIPSISILAESPVAVIEENVARHGTRKIAEAYLQFLYSARGQQLAARNHFRPAYPQLVPAAELAQFAPVLTVTIDEAFGGWKKAQAMHFAE